MNICIHHIRVNIIANLASLNIGTSFIGGNKNASGQGPPPESEAPSGTPATQAEEAAFVPEGELIEEPIILPQLEMPPFESMPIEPRD